MSPLAEVRPLFGTSEHANLNTGVDEYLSFLEKPPHYRLTPSGYQSCSLSILAQWLDMLDIAAVPGRIWHDVSGSSHSHQAGGFAENAGWQTWGPSLNIVTRDLKQKFWSA